MQTQGKTETTLLS